MVPCCWLAVVVLFFTGGASQQDNDETLKQAEKVISQVSGHVQNFQRVLEDQQVQELAVIAAADPDKLPNLQQYVSGRIPDLIEIELFPADLTSLRGTDLGPFGYAVLDMLLVMAESGVAPAQMHGKGADSYLAMTVRIGEQESTAAYLLAKIKPESLVSTFNAALSEPGALALDQPQWQVQADDSQRSRDTALRIRANCLDACSVDPVSSWFYRTCRRWRLHGIMLPTVFRHRCVVHGLGLLFKFGLSRPALELREDPVEFSHSTQLSSLRRRPEKMTSRARAAGQS